MPIMKQYILSFYWACTSLTTNVRLADCYSVWLYTMQMSSSNDELFLRLRFASAHFFLVLFFWTSFLETAAK